MSTTDSHCTHISANQIRSRCRKRVLKKEIMNMNLRADLAMLSACQTVSELLAMAKAL